MISVQTTAEAIHVSIPRTEMTLERLEEFLRSLRLEFAVEGNAMTEATADRLAEESKTDWWERNRSRFLPEDV